MGTFLKCCTSFILLNVTVPAICFTQQHPDSVLLDSYAKTIIAPAPSDVAKLSPAITADTNTIIVARDTSFMQIDTKLKAAVIRLKIKTTEAEEFAMKNDFNTEYCFMVDMSIPSGKKRFFVYNMQKDTVELASLVSHGSGSYKPDCKDHLTFSNAPNSFATSLGRYKIGVSYYGTYGLSYKLFGLDSSYSKAFERAIVLHSDSYVPEKETYPRHIYESAGCPIVPPSILGILGKYITKSSKPVLLWIYN